VFRQVGRHAYKELTHGLTDVEFNFAHVHVLINCVEVQSYFEYVLISFSTTYQEIFILTNCIHI